MVRVDLRVLVLDVPSQDVISRDNVSVRVNAVIYFRVVDPERATIQVENFMQATSELAQTTLRSVLGKHELDEMLAERDKLNNDIQEILDSQTDAWGIKVANVEIKHVDISETMVRAIARQAEAERERRAKIINAEGEQQAAAEAARGGRDPVGPAGGHAAALSQHAQRHRAARRTRPSCSRFRWSSMPLEDDRANYDDYENIRLDKLDEMRAKARTEGLWAPQMPKDRGGLGLPMVGWAAFYEEANRSIFGPVILNCQAPTTAT
jgi:uncharacterized membrane protein YqiK